MAILDAVLVLGILGLLVYLTLRLLLMTRPGGGSATAAPAGSGVWQTAHYDVDGTTHVVVQRVSADGGVVLDEHLVALVVVDDPDYDLQFRTAMATARERRSMFEAEQD